MQLSIVVPVYNAEKTLQRCLDSIVPQLNENIEIILINDGSTDGSEVICKEYAKLSNTIRYYFQSNRGVSSVRNRGIELSRGSYISFVDSDDWVKPHYCETIQKAMLSNPDVIFFGVEKIWINGDSEKSLALSYDGEKSPDILYELISSNLFGLGSNKVFSMQLIKKSGTQYDTSCKMREDQLFMIELWGSVRRILCLENDLYCYYQNPTSVVQTYIVKSTMNTYIERIASYEDSYQSLVTIMKNDGVLPEKIRNFSIKNDASTIEQIVFPILLETDRKLRHSKYDIVQNFAIVHRFIDEYKSVNPKKKIHYLLFYILKKTSYFRLDIVSSLLTLYKKCVNLNIWT